MKFFKRNKPLSVGQVGLSLSPFGLTFAYVFASGKNLRLQHVDHIEASKQAQQIFLKEKVALLDLHHAKVNVLLSVSDYQIFLIEQPNVPENEKREAIRWLVAEYIDFSIEEAVVDFIDLPKRKNDENASMIYVVVAKKSKIDETITWINATGLEVKSIDICQSALRYIAMMLENADEGQALLHFEKNHSHLILFKEKKIYMMRDIDLGLNLFIQDEESKEQHHLYQDLSLEIQRSFDYCASNLENAVVSRLILTPMSEKKPHLLSYLSNHLGLPVREIAFSEFLEIEDNEGPEKEGISTLAIGAALNQSL